MEYPVNLRDIYDSEYFRDRHANDLCRLRSFDIEKKFIENFTTLDGTVLDVGCSTGEFLSYIKWKGTKFGIEISDYARIQAKKNGFIIVDEYQQPDSLDVVIYRGTIQHLDSPFRSLQKAHKTLKPGGMIFFLATPNINSYYFRLFNDLPALDSQRNFFLPSDTSLTNIMHMLNFEIIGLEYPYFSSPYANPLKDHLLMLYKIIMLPFSKTTHIKFPFYRNMMNICFKKKIQTYAR